MIFIICNGISIFSHILTYLFRLPPPIDSSKAANGAQAFNCHKLNVKRPLREQRVTGCHIIIGSRMKIEMLKKTLNELYVNLKEFDRIEIKDKEYTFF